MTVTLPHVFGVLPPTPPTPFSFFDDNFNALANAVNAIAPSSPGNITVNAQTGTSYTVVAGDLGKLLTFTNAAAIAVTLPQATGGFAAPWAAYFTCLSTSVGSVTITPQTSTINGAATLVLSPGEGALVVSDGTNYQIQLFIAVTNVATTTPQGRLTLQTGKPVMTADTINATTIFYDTYVGNKVLVGGAVLTIASDEISCGLDAGVPHVASGSNYDIFAVNNAGVLAIGVGPAWTSTTARGSGAGTTQLALKNGVWTNAVSLTHLWSGAAGVTDLGPIAANNGTYLGSFNATANGQTGVQFRAAAASGGSNAVVSLYNAYNRVRISSRSQDNSANYTQNSVANPGTWRAANASNSNRVTFLDGLQQSQVSALYEITCSSAASAQPAAGMNLDSITATPAIAEMGYNGAGSIASAVTIRETYTPQLGLHFVQAMENSIGGAASVIWYPTNQGQQLSQLMIEYDA